MAQSINQQGPPFNPITVDSSAPLNRSSYNSLRLLKDPTFNSYLPYAWGFTIYRIRFDGDSDERFDQALRRFTEWTKWLVRDTRYTENLSHADAPEPSPTNDATDYLADRFYNEVIEINAAVTIEPEGQEDFSAVGQAFSEWVAGLNVDLMQSKNNVRYDHCLIIDKKALESLELLPEAIPDVGRGQRLYSKAVENLNSWHPSWVWVLDRKTCEAVIQGKEVEYPPWLRLHLQFVLEIWFERAKGNISTDWQRLAEEDLNKWETVFWWNLEAESMNEMSRPMRAPGYVMFPKDVDTLRRQNEELLKELGEKNPEALAAYYKSFGKGNGDE